MANQKEGSCRGGIRYGGHVNNHGKSSGTSGVDKGLSWRRKKGGALPCAAVDLRLGCVLPRSPDSSRVVAMFLFLYRMERRSKG